MTARTGEAHPNLTLDITAVDDREALRVEWRELERRAPPNVFLSWHWIGAWLAVIDRPVLRLTGERGGKIVLLGLFVLRRTRRHGIVTADQLCLHETGDPELDRLTIERNGFLLDRDFVEIDLAQVFRHLLASRRSVGWNELVLSGVTPGCLDAAARAGLAIERDQVKPVHGIDLGGLESATGGWLDRLSANTRRQIRRAQTFAGEAGHLDVTRATTVPQALGFFDELRQLHEARWHARGLPGAFAEPRILRFHRTLIATGVPAGAVELLRCAAGGRILGYLYNLISGPVIANYQSGFAHLPDNRDRPGLVCHGLCIDDAARRGFQVYDLLAGDARYKRDIGMPMGEMQWGRAQGPGLALAFERAARRLRRGGLPLIAI